MSATRSHVVALRLGRASMRSSQAARLGVGLAQRRPLRGLSEELDLGRQHQIGQGQGVADEEALVAELSRQRVEDHVRLGMAASIAASSGVQTH